MSDSPSPSFKSIDLIAGLGNPGSEYAETRHNAGEWFVNLVAENFRLSLKTEAKLLAKLAEFRLDDKKIRLMSPCTYMNHSGQALKKVLDYYQLPFQQCLVVHDDLDIPAGAVRFKTGGGHGGHNGLRDIVHHLKSPDFHRLRVGIGHPGHKDQVLDYVLERPSKSDKQKIEAALQEALSILPLIIAGDFQTAMNQLHRFEA